MTLRLDGDGVTRSPVTRFLVVLSAVSSLLGSAFVCLAWAIADTAIVATWQFILIASAFAGLFAMLSVAILRHTEKWVLALPVIAFAPFLTGYVINTAMIPVSDAIVMEQRRSALIAIKEVMPGAITNDFVIERGNNYAIGAYVRGFEQMPAKQYLEHCRNVLPGDWIELRIDADTVTFASELADNKQHTLLVRDVGYSTQISAETDGVIVFTLRKPLKRLDGTVVPVLDAGKYLRYLEDKER
jgi:hypothetical protein